MPNQSTIFIKSDLGQNRNGSALITIQQAFKSTPHKARQKTLCGIALINSVFFTVCFEIVFIFLVMQVF